MGTALRIFRSFAATARTILAVVVAVVLLGVGVVLASPASATPGDLDTGYTHPSLNGDVSAIVPDGDGFVVGGNFTNVDGRNYLIRLNADGSLDQAFNPPQFGTRNFLLTSITRDSNGKFLLVGVFQIGNWGPEMIRLNHDGSLDTGFTSPQFVGQNALAYSVAVDANGMVIVGGDFTGVKYSQAQTYARQGLVRLKADGSIDTSFVPPTLTSELSGDWPWVMMATPVSGNQLLVGGYFTTTTGGTSLDNLIRLNADGSVDPSFVAPSLTDTATVVVPDGDGYVFGGYFTGGLMRLKSNGSLDGDFTPPTLNGVVHAIVPDGAGFIVGGEFTDVSNRDYLIRVNSDGTLDSAFNSPSLTRPVAAAAADNTGFLVGGTFTNDGLDYLARLWNASVPSVGSAQSSAVTTNGFTVSSTVSANGTPADASCRIATTAVALDSADPVPATPSMISASDVPVSCSFSDLLPGTDYYVKVYASNGVGDATPSSVVHVTTDVAAPTVAAAEVASVTRTGFAVTSTVSYGGGSTSVKCRIALSEGGVDTANPVNASPATVGAANVPVGCSFSNLSPATDYYVKVYASNTAGNADSGNALHVKTNSASAPVVVSPNAPAVDSRSASVAATVSANGASATVSCVVASSEAGLASAGQSVAAVPATVTGDDVAVSCSFAGLSPGTKYFYRVSTLNQAGTSASQVQSFTTARVPPGVARSLKVSGAVKAKKRVVTWLAPVVPGTSENLSYRVIIKRGSKTMLTKTVTALKLQFTKSKAYKAGKYTAFVQAGNSAGYATAVKKAFKIK